MSHRLPEIDIELAFMSRDIAVPWLDEDLFGDTGARMQKLTRRVVRLSNQRDHLLMENGKRLKRHE